MQEDSGTAHFIDLVGIKLERIGDNMVFGCQLQRTYQVFIYALLTKREVKMAGYWPSSFFFAFLWMETKSRSIKTRKKERGQYPAILTEQGRSIKDLLYGQKVTPLKYLFQRAGECVHS